MGNEYLSPLDAIANAANAGVKPDQLKNQPESDFFNVPVGHLQQRAFRVTDKEKERITEVLSSLDKGINLIAENTYTGLTGKGNHDQMLFALHSILDKNNRFIDNMFGNGISSFYSEDILKTDLQGNDNLQSRKIIINCTLIELASKYYGKKTARISGGEMVRTFQTLRALNELYYIYFIPKTENNGKNGFLLRKFINLPQTFIPLEETAKNINLFIEVDPLIYALENGGKYVRLPQRIFCIYRKAKHFDFQFLCLILNSLYPRLTSKRRKKSVNCSFLLETVFSVCAAQPQYKKNPQRKMTDLRNAIQKAIDLGLIISHEFHETGGGENGLSLTINPNFHEPIKEITSTPQKY